MYFNFYQKLREVKYSDIPSLAGALDIPESCFRQTEGPILAYRRYLEQPIGYLLRGTLFFPGLVVRGYPKITYGAVHEFHKPFAKAAERMLLSCLKDGRILFEEKIDGINVRMYRYRDRFYFATRMVWDGSNRKGELQWGEMARQIVERKYPGAYHLVKAGYVPVFEMTSPQFTHLSLPAEEDELFLIDVLRDHKFVHREKKERLAAEHGLRVPRVVSTIEGAMTPKQFHKEVRALEHYAEQLGLEGVVAKGFKGDSDQVFLKVKVAEVRAEHWGASIPKRFILEAIRRVRAEAGQETFLDGPKALRLILEELSGDFVIPDKEKVRRYYKQVRAEAEQERTARARAETILQQGFTTRKELALYLEKESENPAVRWYCFELCNLK